MKYYIITLFSFLTFSVNGQQANAETEIHNFVKKETKYLHKLKFKKYYRNFVDEKDFVIMFKGEKIDRNRHLKKNIRKLKREKDPKDYSKFELILTTPFKEFYDYFDLYILTKKELEKGPKKEYISKIFGTDITKIWNPKIKFTENKYLICLLPKIDLSDPKKTKSKYGEFLVLQILEKHGNKWKVYSSWN